MYDNISKKIKGLAMTIGVLGTVVGVIYLLTSISQYNEYSEYIPYAHTGGLIGSEILMKAGQKGLAALTGIYISIPLIIFSLISTWPLYGFGQLIESTMSIENMMKKGNFQPSSKLDESQNEVVQVKSSLIQDRLVERQNSDSNISEINPNNLQESTTKGLTKHDLQKLSIFTEKCNHVLQNSNLKKCSECAENISIEAKKCKFCGETFNNIKEFTDNVGNVFLGEENNNQENGKGKMIYKDGKTYTGEWKKGKFHGEGILTSPDGAKYFGEFQYGKKHGIGTYIFPGGDKYVGEYRDGERHGMGLYKYANGDEFWGEWEYGLEHGMGTHTWKAGKILTGLWEHGEHVECKVRGDY